MAFEARFGGPCAVCPERIRPGQQVTYVEDELVHDGCEDVATVRRRPAEVCTSCWLEKPCECDDRGAA